MKKKRIRLCEAEWQLFLHALNNELRTPLINEGGYTDVVDEDIIKIVNAPIKKTKSYSNRTYSNRPLVLLKNERSIAFPGPFAPYIAVSGKSSVAAKSIQRSVEPCVITILCEGRNRKDGRKE